MLIFNGGTIARTEQKIAVVCFIIVVIRSDAFYLKIRKIFDCVITCFIPVISHFIFFRHLLVYGAASKIKLYDFLTYPFCIRSSLLPQMPRLRVAALQRLLRRRGELHGTLDLRV